MAFSDPARQISASTFTAGDPIYVQVELSGCLQATPQGIEQLGFRVILPTRLGTVSRLQPGPIVHSGLAFGSNALMLDRGLSAAAFSLYNQYPPVADSNGNEVPTAQPLQTDGVLCTFQISTSESTPVGNYGLVFSSTPGDLSLVSYNGSGSTPETSNLVPTADYLHLSGLQIEIKAPVPTGEVPSNQSSGSSGGSPGSSTEHGSGVTDDSAEAKDPSQQPSEDSPDESTLVDSGQYSPEQLEAEPAGSVQDGESSLLVASVVEVNVGEKGYLQDGQRREMVACYYRGADTMMPIRLLEAFGVELFWDQASETATFTVDGRTVQLTLGSSIAKVNGAQKKIVAASGLTIAAEVKSGRMMVPLRFVSEELGFKVHWSPPGKITINYSEH